MHTWDSYLAVVGEAGDPINAFDENDLTDKARAEQRARDLAEHGFTCRVVKITEVAIYKGKRQ